MKNRKCPYKGSLCLDYGSCESCEWGKLINRYEKRIKRLKTELAAMRLVAASLANELNITDEEFDEEVKTARKKVKGEKK